MSFIVIEGLDGSGKSTQIKNMLQYLADYRIRYQYLHFPRTDTPVWGELISRFLRGELGDINQVDPYVVALLYAGDRNDIKNTINGWLQENNFVFVDRYVCSNIAFQCAKTATKEESDKLKNWILELEYQYNRIPRPDINIFLDVPFSFTSKNLTSSRNGDDRQYLNGKADIHEESLDFQAKVREKYLEQIESDKTFVKIDCSDGQNNMLSPGMIFDKIIEVLKEKNAIK